MTDRDRQKAEYLDSWEVFFLKTLGWSEMRVSEWTRRTGKDRLLDDAESWLYHDPPVMWAVEALLSHVLPEQLSSKVVTGARNEILRGFEGENYRVSPKSDWTFQRGRINEILRRYGTQLPRTPVSPLTQRGFPESGIRRREGSFFAPSSDAPRMIVRSQRSQFVPKKLTNRGAIASSPHRATQSRLITGEFVRI